MERIKVCGRTSCFIVKSNSQGHEVSHVLLWAMNSVNVTACRNSTAISPQLITAECPFSGTHLTMAGGCPSHAAPFSYRDHTRVRTCVGEEECTQYPTYFLTGNGVRIWNSAMFGSHLLCNYRGTPFHLVHHV